MTRTRTPRTPKKPPSRGLRPWLGWAIKLSLVALVVLAGFAVYLDAIVQEKFSGKRWTIPAKVYARPLELFVGQKLSRDDFLTELDALQAWAESSFERLKPLFTQRKACLLYTSPSPRDGLLSRMPSSA